jgi:hypothetical protein
LSTIRAIRRVDFLLQQFATVLNLDMDLLYFLTRQVPFDIDFNKVSHEQAVAAYRAFREIMTGKKRGSGENRPFEAALFELRH